MPLIAPETLAEGALRALEHAFRLADDAFLLLERQRWSSAVVLAVFAREELGRYLILAQHARQAAGGGRITVRMIRKSYEDHEAKLRRGFTATTIRLSPEDSAALTAAMNNPALEDSRRLRNRLDQAHEAKGRRQHHDAHELRLRALYVELSPDGKLILPSSVTQKDARIAVRDVAGDCANTAARFWNDADLQTLIAAAKLVPSFAMPLALVGAQAGSDDPS